MNIVLQMTEMNVDIPPVVEVSDQKYSYEQMQQDLYILKERYPEKMEIQSLGMTADGRDITEVILGEIGADHHILIQASMHAREYMNTVLAMNQIEDYLRYEEDRRYDGILWKELYQNVCLHVIPMVNPDGVMISQEGMSAIKDEVLKEQLEQCYESDRTIGRGEQDRERYFRMWKANAKGVDLNRNFDAGWKEYIGSRMPSADCYKGMSPASESETRAVLSVAEKYTLDCCVAYHSFGNLIYWNYGSQGEILDADQQLAKCVSDITGYEMVSTVQDSTDAAGCSDYFVLKLGIPAVTIENGGCECPLPIEEYQLIYQKNQDLWPALAYMYGYDMR